MTSGTDAQAGVALAKSLEEIVDGAIRDAVVLVDDDHVTFFNAAAERLWRLRRDQVLGKEAEPLWSSMLRVADHNCAAPSGRWTREQPEPIVVRREDGSEVGALLRVTEALVEGRRRHLAVLHDMSDDDGSLEQLRRLSIVVNAADRAVVLLDEALRIIYVNPAFTDMLGYEISEAVGRMPIEFLAKERADLDVVARVRRKIRETGRFNEEFLARHKHGREIRLLASVNPIRDTGGVVRNVLMLVADTTKDAQLELLRRNVLEALTSEMPLRGVADHLCKQVEIMAPEVVSSIILIDDEGRLRPLAAPRLPAAYCAAIDGAEIGEGVGSCGTSAFRGEPVKVLDIASDPLWAPYQAIGLPEELKACWSSPIKRPDGRVLGTFAFYYRDNCGPTPWHEQIVETCLHLCMIAIERHRAKQQIAQLSHFDALTGLPNRSRFQKDIAGYLRGGSAAFFFIGMDRFKGVNEALGHSAGDKLLVEVAHRLRSVLGPGEAVYRFTGDEFLMALPECTADKASSRADKALQVLAEPLDIAGVSLALSASIGIGLFPENGTDGSTLLKRADTALSRAKAAGRGTYYFFSPEMDRVVQERLVLGAALRKAIADEALELRYQPQVDPRTLGIFGVEALSRWNDPVLGWIPPDRFIPLAEDIGQIEAIGIWSLREACRQMAEWIVNGVAIPAVSVNLSLTQFRKCHLPETIGGLLREYGLPPQRLTIEITEGVMMDGSAGTLDTIRAVRGLGVGLSVDDFGTGFSSLSSLSSFPVTEVKIDRSFMRDFSRDASALALATAVVRIGQSLGLKVVAEGVETEDQCRLLAELSCHAAQGYLFSKALTPAELASWMAGRDRVGTARR